MKKLLFLFSLIVLMSCSNSDETSNSSNSDFHPPSWIQGVWKIDSEFSPEQSFSFTSNDFCMTSLGTVKQCYQENVNQLKKSGVTPTVQETITETTYTAEINYFAGQSVIFSFRKISDNSIEWTAVPGSVFVKQ